MQLQVAANGRDAEEHAASDELAAEFKSVVVEVEDEAVRDPMRVWESSVYCTPEGCRFPAAQYGAEERPLFCARVEKRNQDGKMQVCGGGGGRGLKIRLVCVCEILILKFVPRACVGRFLLVLCRRATRSSPISPFTISCPRTRPRACGALPRSRRSA
jgi:hypothetical protein